MKTTENALRQVLLELALGSNKERVKNRDDKTIPPKSSDFIVPITPSIESAIQLSHTTPQISDPEYRPSNKKELMVAMSAIAELVEDRFVGDFYEEVKELYTNFTGNDIA